MKSILEKIAAERREDIEQLKVVHPLDHLKARITNRGAGRFRQALAGDVGVSIIAEIKKGSPSRGVIATDFNPVLLARQYKDGGAAALSVLTEERHFFGRAEYMSMARTESGLPILCKDFIIDKYQLYYARANGADAVLLIVRLHDVDSLRELRQIASSIGLDCLVEVHDEGEVEAAVEAGSEIIGVNNRNLADFSVDLAVSERLAKLIPTDVIKVTESGIFTPDDIRRMRESGYGNFLIGEALMRSTDPVSLIQELRAA